MEQTTGMKKQSSQEELSIPPSFPEYNESSDIEQIIENAKSFVGNFYAHKLKEGVTSNDTRAFHRSISLEGGSLENSMDKDGFLRTEISATQLNKLESDILPGIHILFLLGPN